MKMLIVKGSYKDVREITNGLIERYGNISVESLCDKFNKEVLILE